MNERTDRQSVGGSKVFAIWFLYLTSIGIVLLGISFCVYSFATNATFLVMSTELHGSVFGLVVSFLGVRYFLAVRKLRSEVYKSTSRFSWRNFKKGK